jgi:tetratricopeptide (TPR) repeat protein
MNSAKNSCLALIAFGSLVVGSIPAFAADVNLADGYQQLSVGNTEKAVDIFTRKVSKNPTSAACHTALGKALKRLGRIDEAKAEFRKATEVGPDFPDGFYELGVVQESDRNWVEAAKCFERFLQLKPDASERQALTDRIQYCLSQSPNVASADLSSIQQSIQQAAARQTSVVQPVSQTVIQPDSKQVSETPAAAATVITQPAGQTANTGAAIKQTIAKSDVNKPIRDKWALIVGIGNFGSQDIPHLKYATKDARDLYNYLIHEANFAPDHVRLLLDEKATQRRIMSELGSKFLARLAKPDDLIFLFFSTHGSPSQMDIRGKNYIVAYDSDPEDLFATGIEMQKILESIQSRVLSDRVLLVLDACHSGGVNPDAKGMTRIGNFDAEELAEGSGQMVMCSSQPDQQSWESKRYQNGVFTKSLLDGLHKAGPKAPLSKAFSTMEQLVQDEVREDHPGARQTPILHSKWNGNDLVLAVPASSPEKIPPTVASELEPDSSGSTGSGSNPLHTKP